MSTGPDRMLRFAPRHARFVIAFVIGLVVASFAWLQTVAPLYTLLIGVDAMFISYLTMMVVMLREATPDQLRKHAARADEGIALILILALLAVGASIAAIFLVLNGDNAGTADRIAALISLPLGWTTIHVLAAFHYAHLFYRKDPQCMGFPGDSDPDGWDFVYASFTIGMTSQVSDVTLQSGGLRKAVLLHAVAAFFYNTVITAFAVNAAVNLSQ